MSLISDETYARIMESDVKAESIPMFSGPERSQFNYHPQLAMVLHYIPSGGRGLAQRLVGDTSNINYHMYIAGYNGFEDEENTFKIQLRRLTSLSGPSVVRTTDPIPLKTTEREMEQILKNLFNGFIPTDGINVRLGNPCTTLINIEQHTHYSFEPPNKVYSGNWWISYPKQDNALLFDIYCPQASVETKGISGVFVKKRNLVPTEQILLHDELGFYNPSLLLPGTFVWTVPISGIGYIPMMIIERDIIFGQEFVSQPQGQPVLE